MNAQLLLKAANNIRILSATMVEKANSGHPGGAMGGADFINALYSSYLVHDPADPHWFSRDRFFLDPGHMSPMLYSVLYLCGKYTAQDLRAFRSWGSITPGHPELDVDHGVENTSGPLGQGHVMAVGCAIAERFICARFSEVFAHKTYAYISDGGIQEGISQEAARIAGYLGLHNLIMFYDSNDVQLSTDCNAVSTEDTAMKYRAWNWNVIEADGTDPIALCQALEQAQAEKERPTIIIGKTVMGRGCVTESGEAFEGKCSTHGQPISHAGANFAKTIENLGGTMDDPWAIFPEVAELYAKRAETLKSEVAKRKQQQEQWVAENPALAQKLNAFINNELPEIDFSTISIKDGAATREASAAALSAIAEKMENMIVISADLANSDKTDAFLKKTGAFTPHDFKGAFLHAGVSELAMAVIANGIALHGGLRATCATFFVFSDYMKPAVRLAALMELPVTYVWTHDSFRVGEDGPTHEPIEQEAQIRLMEELHNHSGKPSLLALRPADSAETFVAWKMALENKCTPTALILSRQGIADLPTASGQSHYQRALQIERGGYVVLNTGATTKVTLVATGSEVATLCAVAERLCSEGIHCTVASIPSIGLFMEQDQTYRNSVINPEHTVIGLTAGLPSTLHRLAPISNIIGLDHFGASAPYKILEEKFGFTVENLLTEVKIIVKNSI